ncbi:MAG: hypothetical protein SRB1_00002 [Desulfobacteraceae bacterium Eth-SRB1]|nr:MAG: hypothetical protein SRB1_00002 [Desulfobacteraceae bacterium Eth-SRB1]
MKDGFMDLCDLKRNVVELMRENHKIPGKISEEEVEGFYNVIKMIENISKPIDGAKISWAYYNGISWSRKSFKEIVSKSTWNVNESCQYYRSPYFSIEYNSTNGFSVKRNESCQEIRKNESDIDKFVNENNYVYYAIKVRLVKEDDFEQIENSVSKLLHCRIEKKTSENSYLAVIIPHSNLALTNRLKDLTTEMGKISKQIKLVSDTISNGFFLGGQRKTTHIQILENEYGDIEYK